MKIQEFKPGMRVKEKDEDTRYFVYGRVKEVKEKSVIINWDDPDVGPMEVEHTEDELETIKVGSPLS